MNRYQQYNFSTKLEICFCLKNKDQPQLKKSLEQEVNINGNVNNVKNFLVFIFLILKDNNSNYYFRFLLSNNRKVIIDIALFICLL